MLSSTEAECHLKSLKKKKFDGEERSELDNCCTCKEENWFAFLLLLNDHDDDQNFSYLPHAIRSPKRKHSKQLQSENGQLMSKLQVVEEEEEEEDTSCCECSKLFNLLPEINQLKAENTRRPKEIRARELPSVIADQLNQEQSVFGDSSGVMNELRRNTFHEHHHHKRQMTRNAKLKRNGKLRGRKMGKAVIVPSILSLALWLLVLCLNSFCCALNQHLFLQPTTTFISTENPIQVENERQIRPTSSLSSHQLQEQKLAKRIFTYDEQDNRSEKEAELARMAELMNDSTSLQVLSNNSIPTRVEGNTKVDSSNSSAKSEVATAQKSAANEALLASSLMPAVIADNSSESTYVGIQELSSASSTEQPISSRSSVDISEKRDEQTGEEVLYQVSKVGGKTSPSEGLIAEILHDHQHDGSDRLAHLAPQAAHNFVLRPPERLEMSGWRATTSAQQTASTDLLQEQVGAQLQQHHNDDQLISLQPSQQEGTGNGIALVDSAAGRELIHQSSPQPKHISPPATTVAPLMLSTSAANQLLENSAGGSDAGNELGELAEELAGLTSDGKGELPGAGLSTTFTGINQLLPESGPSTSSFSTSGNWLLPSTVASMATTGTTVAAASQLPEEAANQATSGRLGKSSFKNSVKSLSLIPHRLAARLFPNAKSERDREPLGKPSNSLAVHRAPKGSSSTMMAGLFPRGGSLVKSLWSRDPLTSMSSRLRPKLYVQQHRQSARQPKQLAFPSSSSLSPSSLSGSLGLSEQPQATTNGLVLLNGQLYSLINPATTNSGESNFIDHQTSDTSEFPVFEAISMNSNGELTGGAGGSSSTHSPARPLDEPDTCSRPRHVIQADRSVVNHILESQQNFVIARVPIRKYTAQQQAPELQHQQHHYQMQPQPSAASSQLLTHSPSHVYHAFPLATPSYAFATTNRVPVIYQPAASAIEVETNMGGLSSSGRSSIWQALANLVSGLRFGGGGGGGGGGGRRPSGTSSLSDALQASSPTAMYALEGPLLLATRRHHLWASQARRRARRLDWLTGYSSQSATSRSTSSSFIDPMQRLLMLKTAQDNEVCSPVSEHGNKIKYSCLPNYCVARALAAASTNSAMTSSRTRYQDLVGNSVRATQQHVDSANRYNGANSMMSDSYYVTSQHLPRGSASSAPLRLKLRPATGGEQPELQVHQFDNQDMPNSLSQMLPSPPLITYTHINAYEPPAISRLVQPQHQQYMSTSSQNLDAYANIDTDSASDPIQQYQFSPKTSPVQLTQSPVRVAQHQAQPNGTPSLAFGTAYIPARPQTAERVKSSGSNGNGWKVVGSERHQSAAQPEGSKIQVHQKHRKNKSPSHDTRISGDDRAQAVRAQLPPPPHPPARLPNRRIKSGVKMAQEAHHPNGEAAMSDSVDDDSNGDQEDDDDQERGVQNAEQSVDSSQTVSPVGSLANNVEQFTRQPERRQVVGQQQQQQQLQQDERGRKIRRSRPNHPRSTGAPRYGLRQSSSTSRLPSPEKQLSELDQLDEHDADSELMMNSLNGSLDDDSLDRSSGTSSLNTTDCDCAASTSSASPATPTQMQPASESLPSLQAFNLAPKRNPTSLRSEVTTRGAGFRQPDYERADRRIASGFPNGNYQLPSSGSSGTIRGRPYSLRNTTYKNLQLSDTGRYPAQSLATGPLVSSPTIATPTPAAAQLASSGWTIDNSTYFPPPPPPQLSDSRPSSSVYSYGAEQPLSSLVSSSVPAYSSPEEAARLLPNPDMASPDEGASGFRELAQDERLSTARQAAIGVSQTVPKPVNESLFRPASVNDIVAQARRENSQLEGARFSGNFSVGRAHQPNAASGELRQVSSQPSNSNNKTTGERSIQTRVNLANRDEPDEPDDDDFVPHQYQIQLRYGNTSSSSSSPMWPPEGDAQTTTPSSSFRSARSGPTKGGEVDKLSEKVKDSLFEHREEEHWHERKWLRAGKKRKLVDGKWVLVPLHEQHGEGAGQQLDYGPRAETRDTPIKDQLPDEPSEEQVESHFAIPTPNFRHSKRFLNWVQSDVNMLEDPGEPKGGKEPEVASSTPSVSSSSSSSSRPL